MKSGSARRVAYELLRAVEVDGAYANLELPRLLKDSQLDSRDTAFAQELAFGALRNQIFYDAVIEQAANRGIEDVDPPVRCVLRLGAHQLLGMRVPSHAALSETVELAKQVLKPTLAGFTNGVLRRVSEKARDVWLADLLEPISDRFGQLELEYSHPAWIIRALSDALRADGRVDELELLLASDNIAPLVNLVALPGRSEVQELASVDVEVQGVSPLGAVVLSGEPAKLAAVKSGKARVQDQGSQLVALALAAAPVLSNPTSSRSEEWLDLCAGPGGKAVLLAALASGSGAELVCNELQQHRAVLVEQALRHAGQDCFVRVGDGRDLGADAPESFDRILLDAPCSGLGALRRRAEARYRKSSNDLAELTKLQRDLFASAFAGLRPGGVIAYSTCSPHLAETTAIVDWAIREFGERIELLDARDVLGSINHELTDSTPVQLTAGRKTIQLWPHVQGTDAMFLALLRKTIK